ncbi:glycosyl transferase group 1 [Ectothiorhodospira sp. PHS-1]|uniref:glycosyltransferase family 4 protein n=1 Tax=Ectothiorhodospira sp. PHS-1 TaxID=519989 RepID=UPI00024A8A01|nr:glycosyltransferase family 4 protein [Ectothiorhodospira sp. PHS-1]EHQ53672.1 glycosyl transferase group 1 [Ectothiorhodospira sp. PHS-1]
MKIAQVSPLYESVPPKLYGGTERVVCYLTEALIDKGHDVTLFASGDSETRARLVAGAPQALRLAGCRDTYSYHMIQLDQVLAQAEEFDLIHFHVDYLHFPASRFLTTPHLTTLHGRLDIPELWPLYNHFRQVPVVSISDAQRRPLPFANWQGTVYHGLPENLYRFNPAKGEYLAFLGRISPEKRADRAIEIAIRSEMPLKIAAKVDEADREYFEARIRPLLSHPLVELLGEINDRDKQDFLGNARALLSPIDWPEPFGLVMIEAMACGTPVIAYRQGSVPEVMEDGRTGFIVDSIEQAVEAVHRLDDVPRKDCRKVFETRFSAQAMADSYWELYRRLQVTEEAYPEAVEAV